MHIPYDMCVSAAVHIHRDGLTGQAPDYTAAMEWYLKAAEFGEAGDALAQNNIGQMYASGTGVARDTAQAVAWYSRAADQGYGVAEFNLAAMLHHGAPGVQRDDAAALELARRWVGTATGTEASFTHMEHFALCECQLAVKCIFYTRSAWQGRLSAAICREPLAG